MSSSSLGGVQYVQYEAAHFVPLRELFTTVWGEPRSVEYDSKHWNETLIGTTPAIVALWEDQIVGFYMVWPVTLSDGQQEVLGGQPIDSMIHPDFQGKGMLRELGCRCYELCSARNIVVMYGAPNRTAYPGNVGGLNWCHVGNIIDFVRPLVGRPGRKGSWVEQDGRWINEGAAGISIVGGDAPGDLNQSWEDVAVVRRSWQVSRSRSWMNYRYRSVPGVEYFTISFQDGQSTLAVAVCGLRNVGSRLRATLAEIVATDKASRRAIISAAASFAQYKGARYLFAKMTASDPNSGLYWDGFVPFRRTPLISRTLTPYCFSANAFSPKAWALFGGAFDTM